MDDMPAFERLVAGRVRHHAGSVRPVDDAAIFTAIAAAQSRTWRFQTMFSATKYVLAGAIVALVGGFLLVGVLTQQPSDEPMPAIGATASAVAEPSHTAPQPPGPTLEAETEEQPDTVVRSDLLPGVGLVTEEVEPGVFRVLSDGHREPSRIADDEDRYEGGILDGNIVAGPDGSVWWFGLDGFFRLGEETEHRWPERLSTSLRDSGVPHLGYADLEVGPDGTVWLATLRHLVTSRGGVWSYDGEAWTHRRQGPVAKRTPVGVEVHKDGTVLAVWVNEPGWARLARLGDSDWELLPGRVKGHRDVRGLGDPMASRGDGTEIWLMPMPGASLQRYDGEGWVSQRTPDAGKVERVSVGPDGTLWARLYPGRGSGPSDVLARLDGSDWEVYDASDGIPMVGHVYQGFPGFFDVAPDGSIWFNPDDERAGIECDGAANFDGEILTYFLRDICVYAMDVAPDGSVWLQGGEWTNTVAQPGLIGMYVITPEAIAAAD